MTGKELWAEYQHYTRDITEHGRKLGFGGAAICWIFKSNDFTFPRPIYFALLCFVGYFIADILHGLSAALTIRFFTQYQEKKLWKKTHSIEGEIQKPRWVDWPAFAFFIGKVILLAAGFACIGFHLLKKLVP
jgi:hypothetical protein